MKTRRVLPMISLVLLWAAPAAAQDPLKVDPAHHKIVFENESVRVLKGTQPAGAKSVMHQHPEGLIVSLADARLQFALADGTIQTRDLAKDSALFTAATTHNPVNIGTTLLDVLMIEFKTAAPGKAALPTARPGMTLKMLAENPRGIAYRITAEPTFSEPAGTTHEYDQIIIALDSSQLSLALDGKPARTNWVRGDAQFIGRGVPHAARNAAAKPVEFIVVAIR